MKIENFHCTISIYPDLPWFHTWTSHTGPATFASITALLCNINISLLTPLYAQHQHTSGHQPALMAVSQRKLLYGTAQLRTSSLKHVRRWICHWSRDAGYCPWQHTGDRMIASFICICWKAFHKICTLNCCASSLLESCRNVLSTKTIWCVKQAISCWMKVIFRKVLKNNAGYQTQLRSLFHVHSICIIHKQGPGATQPK